MTAGQLAFMLATVDPDAPVVVSYSSEQAYGDLGTPLELPLTGFEGAWASRVVLYVGHP